MTQPSTLSPQPEPFWYSVTKPPTAQVEDKYTRAAKGGSGGIKAVGNYAGSMLPQVCLVALTMHVALVVDGLGHFCVATNMQGGAVGGCWCFPSVTGLG